MTRARAAAWLALAFALAALAVQAADAAEKGEKHKKELEKKEAEKKETTPATTATLTVQAVEASERGKNNDNPALDTALADYAGVLKKLGYGVYKDAGKDTGSAAAGGTVTLKTGKFTVDINVLKVSRKCVQIKYVVKADGKEKATSTLPLTPGQAAPVLIGTDANPTVFLFKAGT